MDPVIFTPDPDPYLKSLLLAHILDQSLLVRFLPLEVTISCRRDFRLLEQSPRKMIKLVLF